MCVTQLDYSMPVRNSHEKKISFPQPTELEWFFSDTTTRRTRPLTIAVFFRHGLQVYVALGDTLYDGMRRHPPKFMSLSSNSSRLYRVADCWRVVGSEARYLVELDKRLQCIAAVGCMVPSRSMGIDVEIRIDPRYRVKILWCHLAQRKSRHWR